MAVVQIGEFRSPEIGDMLADLLKRYQEGRLLGAIVIMKTGGRRHRIAITGSYLEDPSDALASASRLTYRLNHLIDDHDEERDTRSMPL